MGVLGEFAEAVGWVWSNGYWASGGRPSGASPAHHGRVQSLPCAPRGIPAPVCPDGQRIFFFISCSKSLQVSNRAPEAGVGAVGSRLSQTIQLPARRSPEVQLHLTRHSRRGARPRADSFLFTLIYKVPSYLSDIQSGSSSRISQLPGLTVTKRCVHGFRGYARQGMGTRIWGQGLEPPCDTRLRRASFRHRLMILIIIPCPTPTGLKKYT